MKKSILLLLLSTHVALSQGHYYLHNNSSSLTILPSQISGKHPSGEFNTSLGQDALKVNTGDANTAIGVYSLFSNTSGNSNIGVGNRSLYSNTIGYWNIAIGNNALDENVGGYLNVAVGYDAAGKVASTNYNTAVGTYAMRYITGGYNTALGGNTLAGNGNGGLNVAVGYAASQGNTSGSNNVSIGHQALFNNTSGSGNVAIGQQAGYNETGSNRLYIDNTISTTPLIGGNFSTSKVGINRSMTDIDSRTENFQVQGTAYITGNICAASYNCVSDLRYKKNIAPLQNSLTNVLDLRGVNYYWRIQEFPEQAFTTQRQTGFIAQELEQFYPEMVTTDAKGFKSVDYSRLTPVLVEAIKELNEKILALEKGNDTLKSENTQLKKQNDSFEARLQSLEKERIK